MNLSEFKPPCLPCEDVVRPVGNFRFLNPFDVVQAGDFMRMIVTDHGDLYLHNWTEVEPTYMHVGENFNPDWDCEVIRKLEDSTTVVMFPAEEE